MIKKLILAILGIIVVVVIVLCVVISMQPANFTVTRSATFNAQPDRVFTQVNDFKNWSAWSPWEKLDPNMKKTVSDPSAGKGASYAWTGNDEVGEGKMTIADSHPSEHIKVDLEFIKPFAMKSVTNFTFKPEGDKTTMTWAMTGEHNFVSKAMCLVMDMDKMVGSDFEKGLANLKPIVEAPAAQ
jgi:uncharacterized protein YndB with AHSA1/START domain